MPFNPSVRREALVAAARHCSVCHRYKGVKVEVHHIVPEAQGGSNDLDNAIVLCFDCHADAGHYNQDHPRGTKFSPEELRRARDRWHALVRLNRIEAPTWEDTLYCRYLLCRSFTAINEISRGDLSSMPVRDPLLASNVVGEFLTSIVEPYGADDRRDHVWGDSFTDSDKYSAAHPDVRVFQRSTIPYYPYFRAIRVPPIEELRAQVASLDPLTQRLIEAGVPAYKVSRGLAYDELCGDGGFQEIYLLRPLWAVYLEARNIGEKPVRIRSISGHIEEAEDIGFRSFLTLTGDEGEVALPRAAILPGQSAVIPLALLLAPLDRNSPDGLPHGREQVRTGQVQEVEHADYSTLVRQTAVIGPAIWPLQLKFDVDDAFFEQPIHELDLSNLYTINRYWEAGSCPHLFFVDSNGTTSYQGEIFARAPRDFQTHQVLVPPRVEKLIVAELEAERAWFTKLMINGCRVLLNRLLQPGASLEINVSAGDSVTLSGWYEPEKTIPELKANPLLRNMLVERYLRCRHPTTRK